MEFRRWEGRGFNKELRGGGARKRRVVKEETESFFFFPLGLRNAEGQGGLKYQRVWTKGGGYKQPLSPLARKMDRTVKGEWTRVPSPFGFVGDSRLKRPAWMG